MHPLKKRLLRLGLILGLPLLGYALWTPGVESSDGKFDHARNGLWLAHGWMSDDAWFTANHRDKNAYESEAAKTLLRRTCQENGIAYVFPHLCPVTAAELNGASRKTSAFRFNAKTPRPPPRSR